MSRVILQAASILILGVSLPLHAQEKAPPPAAPFLNPAPEHSAWKVLYTFKNAPPPGPPPLTLMEVDVTKMNSTRQNVSIWSDNQTTEFWNYDGLCMFNQHGNPTVYLLPLSSVSSALSAAMPNYSKSDFPELDWVNAGNYKGVVTYQGHSCYLFQSKPSGAAAAGYNADQISLQQAWIDVKTKLPAAFDDGLKSIRTYTDIKEIPQRDLELPPAFLKELQDNEKDYELSTGKPWKP
jgi:hypothetical protein